MDEATFKSLDAEEKRYWHSHEFEVESGMLTVVSKLGVPSERTVQSIRQSAEGPLESAIDTAERPVLQDIRRTYGKTCHTVGIKSIADGMLD